MPCETSPALAISDTARRTMRRTGRVATSVATPAPCIAAGIRTPAVAPLIGSSGSSNAPPAALTTLRRTSPVAGFRRKAVLPIVARLARLCSSRVWAPGVFSRVTTAGPRRIPARLPALGRSPSTGVRSASTAFSPTCLAKSSVVSIGCRTIWPSVSAVASTPPRTDRPAERSALPTRDGNASTGSSAGSSVRSANGLSGRYRRPVRTGEDARAANGLSGR